MSSHFVIHLKKDNDPNLFMERAAEVLLEGGLIAYPTDTVYGMGADPCNNFAVGQVYELKDRNLDQGLPVLVADIEEAQKVALFSEYDLKLAEKFWPGELTIILPLKTPENSKDTTSNTVFLDKIVTGGADTIALRVPQNPIILGICKQMKKLAKFGGVIGTSANISGGPNPILGKQVVEQFSTTLNFIIDTGKCKSKIPSTIVKIDRNLIEAGESLDIAVSILREGKISKEEILEALS